LAVVPFRHSKLTEALMDYFVGDGRAVSCIHSLPFPFVDASRRS
jgi:kinesin family protein 20